MMSTAALGIIYAQLPLPRSPPSTAVTCVTMLSVVLCVGSAAAPTPAAQGVRLWLQQAGEQVCGQEQGAAASAILGP